MEDGRGLLQLGRADAVRLTSRQKEFPAADLSSSMPNASWPISCKARFELGGISVQVLMSLNSRSTG